MLTEISNIWKELYNEDIYITHPIFMKKIAEKYVEIEDRVDKLMQVIDSQKQTFDALYNKLEQSVNLNKSKIKDSGN